MTLEEEYNKLVSILSKLSEKVTIPSAKNEIIQLVEKYKIGALNESAGVSTQSHASLLLGGPVQPRKGMTKQGTTKLSNASADLL
jgi:hypothetical protein